MSYAKSQKLFVDSKGEKQGRIERESGDWTVVTTRGASRTQSKIYDGALFSKIVNSFSGKSFIVSS